ncbi:MAG: ATP-dependent Clp protease adaptor ClpS [Phycisphaerales bacterium]
MARTAQGTTTEQDQGGTATLPETAPPTPRRLPGWAVLLHDDDVSTHEHVVRSIVMLARLPVHDAIDRMVEAEESGAALLLVTHREHAELLQEQFTSRGMTVTIEPAR